MVNPVPEHVQDAKLHRLTVLLPVLLPVLPLTVLLHLVRVAALLSVNQRRIRYLEPLDEQIQQPLRRTKTSISRQKCTYEFRIGVYVISQSFNEFVEGSALDQGHTAVLSLLQYDVVLGIGLGELVERRRGKFQRMFPLDIREDAVEDALQHRPGVQHDQVGHPRVLVFGALRAQRHRRLHVSRRYFERVLQLVGVLVVEDLDLPYEEALLETALGVVLVHGTLPPRVRLAQDQQTVEEEHSTLGQSLPGTDLHQDVLSDKLVAALAQISRVPVLDVLLDLVELVEGGLTPRPDLEERRRTRPQDGRRGHATSFKTKFTNGFGKNRTGLPNSIWTGLSSPSTCVRVSRSSGATERPLNSVMYSKYEKQCLMGPISRAGK
jgi:hypothetical protein